MAVSPVSTTKLASTSASAGQPVVLSLQLNKCMEKRGSAELREMSSSQWKGEERFAAPVSYMIDKSHWAIVAKTQHLDVFLGHEITLVIFPVGYRTAGACAIGIYRIYHDEF